MTDKVDDKSGLGSKLFGWLRTATGTQPKGVSNPEVAPETPQQPIPPEQQSSFQAPEPTLQDILEGKTCVPIEAYPGTGTTGPAPASSAPGILRFDNVTLTPPVKQLMIEQAPTARDIIINLADQPSRYVTAEIADTIGRIIESNPDVRLMVKWSDGSILTWTPKHQGGDMVLTPVANSTQMTPDLWSVGRFNELDKRLGKQFGNYYTISLQISPAEVDRLIKIINRSLDETSVRLADWQKTAHGALLRANNYLSHGLTWLPPVYSELLSSTAQQNGKLMTALAMEVRMNHRLLYIIESIVPASEAIQRFYRAVRRKAHDTNNSLSRLNFIDLYASSLMSGKAVSNLNYALPPSSDLVLMADTILNQFLENQRKNENQPRRGEQDAPRPQLSATFERPPVPLTFNKDFNAHLFDTALTNIISNAFRYGNSSVSVHFEPDIVGGEVLGVRLHITDNGIGIKDLEKYGSLGFQELRRDVSGSSGTGTYSMIETLMTLRLPFPVVSTDVGRGTDVTLLIPKEFLTATSRDALERSDPATWMRPLSAEGIDTATTRVLVFTSAGEHAVVSMDVFKRSGALVDAVARTLHGDAVAFATQVRELAGLAPEVQMDVLRAYSGLANSRGFAVHDLYRAIDTFNLDATAPVLFTASTVIDESHGSFAEPPMPETLRLRSQEGDTNELRMRINGDVTNEMNMRALSEMFAAQMSQPTRLVVQVDSMTGESPAFKQLVRAFETTLFPTAFINVSFETADQSIMLAYSAVTSGERRVPDVKMQLPTFADVGRMLDALGTSLHEAIQTFAPMITGTSPSWVTTVVESALTDSRFTLDELDGEKVRIGRVIVDAFGSYIAMFGPLELANIEPERRAQIIARFAEELLGQSSETDHPWWLKSERIKMMAIDVPLPLSAADIAAIEQKLPENYSVKATEVEAGTHLEITANPNGPMGRTAVMPNSDSTDGEVRYTVETAGPRRGSMMTATPLPYDGLAADLLGGGSTRDISTRSGLATFSDTITSPALFRPVELERATEAARAAVEASRRADRNMERTIKK